MQKQIAIWLAVFIFGVASFAQTAPKDNRAEKSKAQSESVSALQQQRIKLLSERVTRIESFHNIDLLDRAEIHRAKVDLALAKLEYAKSIDEKRALLTDVIKLHDHLIKTAELNARAPVIPGSPAGRMKPIMASTNALKLKAEQVKFQIMLKQLK